MDAIDHNSSITCRYLPGFYTGTKSHCFVTEPHGCEQLAQSPVRSVSVQWNLAGDRSRDLMIARHMTPFAVCLFPVARDMLFVQSSETLRSRTSSRAVTPSTASLTRTTSLSIAKKLFNAPLKLSVTCDPAEVIFPPLPPAESWYSTELLRSDARLS